MRFLSIILAILILVLNCIPCSDAHTMAGIGSSFTTETHPTTSHSEGEHQDLCSPFCQCACCAIAYALPLPTVLCVGIAADFGHKAVGFHLHQHPVGVSLPVWQPPQLV